MIVDIETGKAVPDTKVLITPEDFYNLKTWIKSVNAYREKNNIGFEEVIRRIEKLEAKKPKQSLWRRLCRIWR